MSRNRELKYVLPFFFALTATIVNAASIIISNHSFEAPVIADGTFDTDAAPDGWTAYGAIDFSARTVGVLNPSNTTLYADGAPDDRNVGVIFLLDDFSNQTNFASIEAGLEQTLSATLQTLTHYKLTVEVGNIANDVAYPHNLFQFSNFPGYRIDLLAGGTVIASETNSLLPSEGNFLTSTVDVDIAETHSMSGQSIGIRLVNLNSAPGIEVNFDNIRLEAIAEPAVITGFSLSNDIVYVSTSNLASGATHVMERANDLAENNWTGIMEFVATSINTNLADITPPTGRAYYRMITE